MTLSGGGRKPININLFKEVVEKSAKVDITWRKDWGWAVPHYLELQKALAKTNLPKIERKIHDNRNLKPFPKTVNHQYGWVATNKDFRLQIYGPDYVGSPINIPNCDELWE